MLTLEENQVMVAWVFSMQEIGLSINVQQFFEEGY
jgi:hypothetical protein